MLNYKLTTLLFFVTIIVLIAIVIPYIIYRILIPTTTKKKAKIIAYLLSIIIGFIPIVYIISVFFVFPLEYFSKNEARDLLKINDIILNDDFKIIKNNKEGLTDYAHIFELKISENDIQKLSEKFNSNTESNFISLINISDKKNSSRKTVNIIKDEKILKYSFIIP